MKTRHHKIPVSQGGNSSKQNIKMVEERDHKLWHKAWDNKTPQNIVRSVEALQLLFGDVKLSELKAIIETEWS